MASLQALAFLSSLSAGARPNLPFTPQVQLSSSTEWKAPWVPLNEPPADKKLGQAGQLHSQVGQDWLVASLLGCKRDGYFVDMAANDAIDLSNTLMLERDFGWQGICVEAGREYMDKLMKRRCRYVQAVVGSPSGTKVDFVHRGFMSGIVGKDMDNHEGGKKHTTTLYTVSLADVLASSSAPSEIDYLSLDVEGAESLVMKDFPWNTYRFHVLTVERPKEDLVEALKKHGYKYVRTNSDFNDETWVHESMPQIEQLLTTWKNGAEATPASCMSSEWPSSLQQ